MQMRFELARVRVQVACAAAALCVSTSAFSQPAAGQESADTSAAGSETAQSAASSDPGTELARRHFSRGIEFYRTGDYEPALLEFRRAYEISGNFRILYNVGQNYQQLRRYADAAEALEGYLREGGAEIDAERQAQVRRDIDALREKVSTVTVTVDVAGAEVLVDHVPVKLDGPLLLDAGDHFIEARRDGYAGERQLVSVVGGEGLAVELHLTPIASDEPESVPAEQPSRRGSAAVWAGWIATGVLGGAAGATGVLAWRNASDLADLRNTPESSEAARSSTAERARGYGIAADALTASAVAVGITSIVLTARRNHNRERPTVSATMGPHGVRLRGQF